MGEKRDLRTGAGLRDAARMANPIVEVAVEPETLPGVPPRTGLGPEEDDALVGDGLLEELELMPGVPPRTGLGPEEDDELVGDGLLEELEPLPGVPPRSPIPKAAKAGEGELLGVPPRTGLGPEGDDELVGEGPLEELEELPDDRPRTGVEPEEDGAPVPKVGDGLGAGVIACGLSS